MGFRAPPDPAESCAVTRPDALTRYVDVLVGKRVYECVQWHPDTDEIVFWQGRTEPLRMPFAYVKRWRPRISMLDPGRAHWTTGPFQPPVK